MLNSKKLWDSVLVEIELAVSKATFNTWFKDTSIEREEGGTVYLSVPNTFVKDWLLAKYHKFILRALRSLSENVRALEYTVSKNTPSRTTPPRYDGERVVGTIIPNASLPLETYYVNKEDNLNPRYTFESFVVGPFNELAHAAAQSIVKSPGVSYNPFFIYGATGHGKTHLIQAIGNKIKKEWPGKKILYVTSERFAVDYMNSIPTGKANLFKEKYRKYDVLIMDDIQFSQTKKSPRKNCSIYLTLSMTETNIWSFLPINTQITFRVWKIA